MGEWFSFWEYTAEDWAGLQFFVIVAAALVALWQVLEARRVRLAQARPFVIVDFDVTEKQEIYIVISNAGTTIARDVRLAFDPVLTSSLDLNPNVVAPRKLKPLSEGIPSLPPRKEISLMLDVFFQRSEDDYPDVFQVQASYYSPVLRQHFRDEFVLDLGIYRNALIPHRS